MSKRGGLSILTSMLLALTVGVVISGGTTARATGNVAAVESLEDVTRLSSTAVEADTSAAQAGTGAKANPRLGWLVGRVYLRGKPLADARVLVRPAHSRKRWTARRALSSGRFAFHLLAGRYLLAADRGGRLCGAQEMPVRRGQETRVVLACR
jgi:hypothetical protein